jgi:hypothetical protein
MSGFKSATTGNDFMKAYVYGTNGAAITDVAKPAPKGTQVLVRVRACGLNRADLGMTKGHAHGRAGGVGTVLGMEWAGEVAEVGPEAKGVKPGDKVMGSGNAAFAEYTLADHGRLFRTPSNMNLEEAATLPVALATMHNAVVTNGALQPGQSVLIQGASSGVGLMALQIAKLMHLKGSLWKALFEKAAQLASFDYNDPFAQQLVPLWRFLLLRNESRDFVLRSLAGRREGIRTAKEPATDKVNAAIEFSRLSLNFSEADARAFFEEAIALAQQIDREAMNQIEVIHALTGHFENWDKNSTKEAAPIAANIFSDIAERLRNEENFPWTASVSSLVRLHEPTALAVVSRWSDQGLHNLSRTLQLFLEEIVRIGRISPSLATALLGIADHAPNKLKADIIESLKSFPQTPSDLVLEELASECLLLERPTLIANQAQAILKAAKAIKGKRLPTFTRMAETFQYLDARKTKEPRRKAEKQSVPHLAGRRFITQAAIENEYKTARKNGGYFDLAAFLSQMIEATSSPGDRVPFLNALVVSNIGSYGESVRVSVILAALSAWESSPSIQQWRSRSLPPVIVRNFTGLTRRYGGHSKDLIELLSATGLPNAAKLGLLAESLEGAGLSLDSNALFEVAKLMAGLLTPEKALEVFQWYLLRLNDRVLRDGAELKPDDLPNDLKQAVGRFLFALMGDIDTRIRWRAAHATRRLARLGETISLNEIFANYDRVKDDAFRAPGSPYYFLAGRLWAVMSAARISHEAPQALVDVRTKLLAVALDEGFPHLLIREHAKAALLALHDTGYFEIDHETMEKIRKINVSPFEPNHHKENQHPRIDRGDRENRRFDFGYDTVEYMLSPILRMFVGLTKQVLFERLEHWLVDQWHAPEKVHYWDLEPRKSRYTERDQSLSHSDKGSLPIIERQAFYLEWHAILCAVGELMLKYPLWKSEDDWGTLNHWLSDILLTEPPVWLADLRDPKPLEDQFWLPGKGDEKQWLSRVSRQDFFPCCFLPRERTGTSPDWTAPGHLRFQREKREWRFPARWLAQTRRRRWPAPCRREESINGPIVSQMSAMKRMSLIEDLIPFHSGLQDG